MTLDEAQALANERWPLLQFNRKEYLALYEHHEALVTALQWMLNELQEHLSVVNDRVTGLERLANVIDALERDARYK